MTAVTPEAKRARRESDRARKQALREQRAAEGLAEVRGIWAPKEHHAAIKEAAAKALDKPHG